jgi:DNA-directed RNA polymerase subunit RPC12/RpoP
MKCNCPKCGKEHDRPLLKANWVCPFCQSKIKVNNQTATNSVFLLEGIALFFVPGKFDKAIVFLIISAIIGFLVYITLLSRITPEIRDEN